MPPESSSRMRKIGAGLALGALVGLLAKDLNLFTLVSYWQDRAPWVLAAAVAGAVIWNTPLRWLLGLSAAGLGLLWIAVAFTPLCIWMAKDLPRRETPEPADAVFVLGSKLQMDGELTDEATARLLHGLELLGLGLAPRIIVSELPPPSPSHEEACRKLMANLGMDQEIVSVGTVRNTHDEAVAVGALFRERGWKRLLVVTSPTHSRRASLALENEGVEVISSPSMETNFDLENLDSWDERIRAFGDLIHERVGLWAYSWRGWLPEGE